ncbi:glycosyltransferase family 4 protein [Thermocrinis sp.]
MRILWVNGNPNPNFGGTELHTISMVKELGKRNVDLLLVCAKNSYVDKHTMDVKKYHIPFGHSLSLGSMKKLYEVIKQEKVDAIIANNGKEYPDVLYCAKIAKRKVFFFRHMSRMKQWLVRRLVFPFVDKFFAVSDYVKRNLISEGVQEERIQVIYNLIEEERFKPLEKPKDRLNLLFVGKLDEGKGVFDFVSACILLLKKGYPINCLVVGSGPAQNRIRELIKGLEDRFMLVGYTPRVEEYYGKANICVVPSRGEEAFPRVCLEALSSGCALVVSNSGGQSEAVLEGFNGYIFEKGDFSELVQKLSLAIERWEEFSENSIKLYQEKFSKENTIKLFLNALRG